jgi:hypothetical protein
VQKFILTSSILLLLPASALLASSYELLVSRVTDNVYHDLLSGQTFVTQGCIEVSPQHRAHFDAARGLLLFKNTLDEDEPDNYCIVRAVR